MVNYKKEDGIKKLKKMTDEREYFCCQFKILKQLCNKKPGVELYKTRLFY